MAGDPFKRAQAGEPLNISARTWNKFIDASMRSEQNQSRNPIGAPTLSPPTQGLTVRVKNNSGADVPRFGILRITGSVFNPAGTEFSLESFENTPVLEGDETDDDPDNVFVVTKEPIVDGQIGRAVLSGIVPVTLNVIHAAHTHATMRATDSESLDSAMFGHRIYFKESGTGSKRGYINLGMTSCNPYKAKASEDIAPAASGDFKFCTGLLGSLTAIGGDFTGKYPADADAGTITSGSELFVSWVLGEWIITPVECPEEA